MPEKALKNVAAKYHLTPEQLSAIFELLDKGLSIPYLLRYHKELAAGLDSADIYDLIEEGKRIEKLVTRREKILKKLRERDILTDDLREKIEQAQNMRELIDFYVPYRPRKRSLSRQALAQGLDRLAGEVLAQKEPIADMAEAARPYVDPEKGLETVEAVLEGIFHIVTDWVAEEKTHRDHQRKVFAAEAQIVCSRAGRAAAGRLGREYRMYFSYRAPTAKLHAYHMLNILRGKRLRVLQYRLEPPLTAMAHAAAELYLPGGAGQYDQIVPTLTEDALACKSAELKKLNGTEFLAVCLKYSLDGILAGITARDLDKELCAAAEKLALKIIRRNVQSLLMSKPLTMRLLGIHPGYRTGCNLAALGQDGAVLETTTVYPHPPQNEMEKAKAEISRIVETHGIEVVVIGEGTGARETEALISGLIAEKRPDLRYTVVPEIGIEAYSKSRSALSELPDVDPRERCAVALCRRVRDPLSELVKINPRELCPEPYVDDVNGGSLKALLENVIEECVCQVGVDANEAHFSLLRYVSGIGPETALEVVACREKNGPFTSREQLRQVPRLDADSYERAVGFIRVRGGENPLDATRIHPHFYDIAETICRQLEISLADLATEEGRAKVRENRGKIQLAELEKEFSVHYLLLKEIMNEMAEPWADPRAANESAPLRQKGLTLETIEPEQWLLGTVRNIVDFGVFVDIGIGEDGLVHISELSDSYVESPYDVVCVGDTVRARVVRVDREKGRIALSMRSESRRKSRPSGPPRRRRPSEEHRRAEQRPAARTEPASKRPAKPAAAPAPRGVRAPMSTRGMDSRRVQKASIAEHLARQQNKPVPLTKSAPKSAPKQDGGQDSKQPAGVGLASLLQNLSFAAIERRGSQSADEANPKPAFPAPKEDREDAGDNPSPPAEADAGGK